MPAGEVSALLQLEVNAVAVYFLIQIFSESRKKKIGTPLELMWVAGAPGWFPACRRGCGPGSQNHHGGRNRAQTASPLGVASVPAGELRGTEGERGLALCHTSYCIFRNGRSLCLAFDERASCEPCTREVGSSVSVLCKRHCV